MFTFMKKQRAPTVFLDRYDIRVKTWSNKLDTIWLDCNVIQPFKYVVSRWSLEVAVDMDWRQELDMKIELLVTKYSYVFFLILTIKMIQSLSNLI